MRLTLPARYWPLVDAFGSCQRFIAAHYGRPIDYPSLEWLWANGEGVATRTIRPPQGSMVGRYVELAHRCPGLPDRTEYCLLRARATHDGRPMAEVFRRLVRDHFDSPRAGQVFTASPHGYPQGYPHRPCSVCDNDPNENRNPPRNSGAR